MQVVSVVVLHLLLVFVSADADAIQGTLHTQEGSTCNWKQLRYGESVTVQGFHLDCSCKDYSGHVIKYSCTYRGDPEECLGNGEHREELEREFFHGLASEARGQLW